MPGLFRRLADAFRGPERRAAGEDYLWTAPPVTAGVPVSADTALGLTAYYAAVNVLATDAACLPLCVYRRRSDGGRDEVRDDPRRELLSVSPNGETPAIRWRQALMGHTLGRGNGYAEIQRTGRGRPMGLHLLDPNSTRPCRPDGTLVYETAEGKRLAPSSVIHLAGFGYDGLCGYSAARLARQAIGLGLAAETFGASFFGNGTTAAGVLKTAQKLNDQAVKRLRSDWSDMHAGPYNAHRPAVLDNGLEWQSITVPPEDAQFLQTRQFQVLEIARWFRLPPHKLGDYSQSHLANIEASNLDYLTTSLMPWLEAIEQELNLKLFTPAERASGLYIEHNMSAFLRGDMAARATFYRQMRDLGVFSPNDIAARENLNPLGPEGDIRLVQGAMVPLDQAGKDLHPKPVQVQRDLRYNPNHGADGKFASGKGGGGGGAAVPAEELGYKTGLGRAFSDSNPAAPVTDRQLDQMVAYADRHYGDWAGSLSEGEVKALRSYTAEGNQYRAINGSLRSGKANPAIERRVAALDSALDRASAPEDLVAYRGTGDLRKVTGVRAADAEALVGTTLRDQGYLSTSLNRAIATGGFTPGAKPHAATFVISVPAGSKAAAIDAVRGQMTPGLEARKTEHELLVARGHGLKITGVHRAGGSTLLYADLVPPEA